MLTKRIIPVLCGLTYLPVCGFLLIVGVLNVNFTQLAVCLFALLCLSIISYRLWTEKYLPKVILGAGSAVLGCLWIIQAVRRIEFAVREGGMERADGFGSPLAFLIGVVSEGLILGVPAVILFLITWLHRNPTKTQLQRKIQ